MSVSANPNYGVVVAGLARVQLSGTAGSPNTDTDFVINNTARAGWTFSLSGDLTKYSGSPYNGSEWFGVSGQSTHSTPTQTYYIRATYESGNFADFGSYLMWQPLTSTRTWYWEAGPGFDVNVGTMKIEIATDSGGTNIVATGYYRGNASSEF